MRLWERSVARGWPIGFYPSGEADPMVPMLWIAAWGSWWVVFVRGWGPWTWRGARFLR